MDRDSVLPPLADDLSRALLRSAQLDEPSAAAYAKVASALGVGAAVGLGASLPAPAVLGASAASASAFGAARWYGSALAKLVLCGVSGVALVAGSALFLRHRAPNNVVPGAHSVALAPAPVPGMPASPASPVLPEPASPALPALLELGPAVAQPLKGAPASASSGARAASAPSVRASSLPEQVLSLDRARVALNSGDPSAALAEIAHYRSAWPKGVFLTEASVLEIEALAKRGESSLAASRAQAFVAAHPDSPQADRLRALIPSGSR